MQTELWIRGLFENRVSEKNGKISGLANSFVPLHLCYYICNYIRIVADLFSDKGTLILYACVIFHKFVFCIFQLD